MRLKDKLLVGGAFVFLTVAAQSTLFNSEDLHEKRAVLAGHSGPVAAVAFSPDGNALVTAGADATARLWDVRVMDLPVARQVLRGHEDAVVAAVVSPNGRLIATAGLDRTVRLWRAKDGRPERVIDEGGVLPFCLAFSTDSRAVASGGDDSAVTIWDSETGRPFFKLRGHQGNVYALAYSRKGLLASGSEDGAVFLWDLGRSTTTPALSLRAHAGLVSALAFSPDGRRLASGGWDRQIKVWDAQTGKLLGLLTGHADAVTSLAFLPDGSLVSGGRDKARFWDPETGVEKELLNAPDDGTLAVAVSPDGHILASGNADSTARLYLLRAAADFRTARPPPPREPTSPW